MGGKTVRSDQDLLRCFDGETLASDAAFLGACDVAENALANLRAGADGIDVPGGPALDDVRLHHDRARALGALFNLAADRFDESQAANPLPRVFPWQGSNRLFANQFRGAGWRRRSRPATTAAPVPGARRRTVANAKSNQRWLDRTMADVRRRAATDGSRRAGEDLRRELGVPDPPRVLVASTTSLLSAGGTVRSVGVDAGMALTVDEYSDGTAEVTLRYLHDVRAEVGRGGMARLNGSELPVGADILAFGGEALASLAIGMGTTRAWKRPFPSAAAARDFEGDIRVAAAANRIANTLPLLDRLIDPGGMQSSPIRERWRRAFVEIDVAIGAHPFDSGGRGAEAGLTAQRSVDFGERTDDLTGLRTDLVAVGGSFAAAASVLGSTWSPHQFGATLVGVSHDDRGTPRSATVTTLWSDRPGLRPPDVPPAGELRSTDDDHHLYAMEVVIDLQDPANTRLASLVDAIDGSESPAQAEHALRLADAVDDEVRARSWITFEEKVAGEPSGLDVEVEATKIFTNAARFEATGLELRTVASWTGPGDAPRQVIGA